MSKWRKALKNKRRFDARYFLNERVEGQEEVIENSVQQEKVKRNFHDFSFDSWLTEDQDLEEAHCTSKRDDEEELEEVGRRGRPLTRPRKTMADLDKDAKTRETDFLKKKKDKDEEEIEEAAKPDFLDLDKDGDKEESMKKAAQDKEEMEEGHDGATKGHSEMSPATKAREMRPFDYDHGQIGDEVFEEESLIGKEEEEPEYGEPMEELVVPGVMPKPDGKRTRGMTPDEIKRKKAKELGPVTEDPPIGLEESG